MKQKSIDKIASVMRERRKAIHELFDDNIHRRLELQEIIIKLGARLGAFDEDFDVDKFWEACGGTNIYPLEGEK